VDILDEEDNSKSRVVRPSRASFEWDKSAEGVVSPSDTRRPGRAEKGKGKLEPFYEIFEVGSPVGRTCPDEMLGQLPEDEKEEVEALRSKSESKSEEVRSDKHTIPHESWIIGKSKPDSVARSEVSDSKEATSSDASKPVPDEDLDSLTADDIQASRSQRPRKSDNNDVGKPKVEASETTSEIQDEDLNSLTAEGIRASMGRRNKPRETAKENSDAVKDSTKATQQKEKTTAKTGENVASVSGSSESSGRLESSLDRRAKTSQWESSPFEVGDRRQTPFVRKLANLYAKGEYVDDAEPRVSPASAEPQLSSAQGTEKEMQAPPSDGSQKHEPYNLKELKEEIRKVYEDAYGPITADHRQVSEHLSSTSKENAPNTENYKEGKFDKDSAHGSAFSEPAAEKGGQSKSHEQPVEAASQEQSSAAVNEALDKNVTESKAETSATLDREMSAPDVQNIQEQAQEQVPDPIIENSQDTIPPHERSEASSQPAKTEGFSTSTTLTYKILCYDPSTEEMHITTTTSTTSSNTEPTPSIPIHEALAALDAPAKFLPYLTEANPTITISKPNLLVLLESSDAASSSSSPQNSSILNSEIRTENEDLDDEGRFQRLHVNPIDGTARLSPTGFSGVDPEIMREEDERGIDLEADQRREYYESWRAENEKRERESEKDGWGWKSRGRDWGDRDRQRERRRSPGVLKTAIVAGAACYAVGVVGELMK
jgi:hypothetical protein